MRRPGRRIEIWQVNEASGELRRKPGRRSYSQHWPTAEVAEVEIKLDAANSPPEFDVWGPKGKGVKSYPDLDAARKRVEEIAKEVTDARTAEGGWEEVVFILSGQYHRDYETIDAFGYAFARALVSAKRYRRWKRDAYGEPKPLSRSERNGVRIPFDARIWDEVASFATVDEALRKQMKGINYDYSGGYWDDDEDETLPEGTRLDKTALLVTYLRGRAELARRLVAGESRRVPRDVELESLRAQVGDLELSVAQACIEPDDDCECAGCALAAQLNVRPED